LGYLGNGGRSKDRAVGTSIGSIDGEAVFAVEGEDLGGGDGVALRKDLYLGIVVWICGDGLPLELDGIKVDVVDGKFTDAEDGGEHGTGKGSPASDGFVLVEGEGELFSAKSLLNFVTKGRDAGGATDEFDGINLIEGET